MFLGVSAKNPCNPRVKAASQKGGNPRFLKTLSIIPLPFILKFCRIQRLIIRRIHIISFCLQTSVHNSQILVRQSDINNNIRFKSVNKLNKFLCVISVNPRRMNFSFSSVKFSFKSVTFRFCPAGNTNFLKNIRILAAFMNNNARDAARSNNQCFSHYFFPP